MSKKKKKVAVGEGTLRKIQITNIRGQLDTIEENKKSGYKPKFGRLIKKLRKKIQNIGSTDKE